MDIAKIDANFKVEAVKEPDVVWHDPRVAPFSIYGIYFSKNDCKYLRIPTSVAEQMSQGALALYSHTAGGRVRFKTNSPYIAIKSINSNYGVQPHLTMVATYGYSIYINGKYYQKITPDLSNMKGDSSVVENDGIFRVTPYGLEKEIYEVEIFMPMYSGVNEFYIGLKESSVILPANPYKYEKPILFYGSSITQGGCASRPGNDYISHLSRKLNSDVLNLGFSGNGRAEKAICEYMASLDPSIYVLDYDHNAPNVEYLRGTHYPLYETIRKAHKDTPIVFISKPDFHTCCYYVTKPQDNIDRRQVILDSYQKAKEQGDNNVYFIDGEKLFTDVDYDACTVDGCHPNDLGFYRMAQTIYPLLKELLEK